MCRRLSGGGSRGHLGQVCLKLVVVLSPADNLEHCKAQRRLRLGLVGRQTAAKGREIFLCQAVVNAIGQDYKEEKHVSSVDGQGGSNNNKREGESRRPPQMSEKPRGPESVRAQT